jgi:LEA14-like dessication related protein
MIMDSKRLPGLSNLLSMKQHYIYILTGITILLLSSCVSMKEPVFNGIGNVQMNKVEKGKSQITLKLNYFNPNKTKARLKNAEGEAWMDSTYIGHFRVDETVDIPANADFIIPVKLEVEMKHILTHSLTAFLNKEVTISLKGKAKVGKGIFYRKVPLQYEGKQNLQELFK